MTALDRTDIILSIIICTYNRNDLIKDCLDALMPQVEENPSVKIILVDNFDDDSNHDELQQILTSYPTVLLVKEKKAGLSIARNRGLATSDSRWVAYIDDDALVGKDYINIALDIINSGRYDCFGGDIRSWWKYSRPKWLEENFGSKPALRTQKGILSEGYNWGSNILIAQKVLKEIGGFPNHIGMKGGKLGYAAENYVQKELRSKGYVIGYHPELYVEHLVDSSKLKWSWHIKAAYAEARDGRFIFPDNYTWLGFFKTIKRITKAPFVESYKLLNSADYFWQNLLIETIKPWATLIGKLRSRV